MATLKNLVDETTNIKNELKNCHTNLRNNLVDKGINCENLKMSSMIDKIKDISVMPNRTGSNIQYLMSNRELNFDAFANVNINKNGYVAHTDSYWIVKGEDNYIYIVSDYIPNDNTDASITKYNLLDNTYETLLKQSSRIFNINNSYRAQYIVFYHNNSICAIRGKNLNIIDLDTLALTSVTLASSLHYSDVASHNSMHIIDNILYYGIYKYDMDTKAITQYINTTTDAGYIPINNSQALSMFCYVGNSGNDNVIIKSFYKIDVDTGVRTALDISHIRTSYDYVGCVNKKGDVLFICGSYYNRKYGSTATEYCLDGAIYYKNDTSEVRYLTNVASLNNDAVATSNYGIYNDNDNFHFVIKDSYSSKQVNFVEIKI